MNDASSLVASEHSYFADEQNKPELEQNKNQIDFSKNSSNPEGIFDTLNKEIKLVVENCKDLSYYSNSNSKISEQQQYNEQFLDSRYWCARKNHNNENDSLNAKIEKGDKKYIYKNNNKNDIIKNNEKDNEEKILYINDEDEDEKNNFNDDDFDEEDMEEKTIEKRENDINEINSIKVNNNNLNNKNIDNSNNKDKNGENNLNKSKCVTESDDQFLIMNEKINSNTPNKVNQPYFPYIYNNQQVHSFVSTYNNYQSTFSKGSFISTNNSSNNKIKKDEDHSSEEDIKINNNNINNINNINIDEIKKNSNNNYNNHGNKFGPHLNNYNQLSNNNNINNINIESANLNNMNNINNISNFNMNNNFLYNRVPKMNLNMVYYIPVQQQPISTNTNYISNNKIYSNLNNIISDNNSNINNLKNKEKVNQVNQANNNNLNNNKNNENNQNNKSSSEEKNKAKENNNSTTNSTNNYKNTNHDNNNYKNGTYRNTETNNSSNSNNNQNNNNICNKGEKNLLNLDDIVSGKDTRTTVMIRNIPIKYTDDILIEELEEFKGKYDCLYMPFDYEKKGNKGYAFINFVNPLHILYFHEKFYGKKWKLFESSKICELNSANFQGIYEIQKHSKNYKGYKKPLFYSEQNNNKNNNESMIIPSKYLLKLKVRFPYMKFHENKVKKIIIVDSFE